MPAVSGAEVKNFDPMPDSAYNGRRPRPRRRLTLRWHGLRALGILLVGLFVGIGVAVGSFQYGIVLFLLVPLILGVCAAWIPYEARQFPCVFAATLLNVGTLLLFFVFGFEGAICIVMAAPLLLPIAAVGGGLGCLLRQSWERPSPLFLLLALVGLPLLLAWDDPQPDYEQPYAVCTEWIVAAPPAAVWRRTIDFTPITAPPEGLLAWGIAYPTHAVLREDGSRLVRECHFTTGPFIEPITVFDPPRRLAFTVESQPPPMKELSPWKIHPPHLDQLLRSVRGELLLEDLGDGRTRLRGTTWYVLAAAPAPYWRWWSEELIGRIHERVLGHIASGAEADVCAVRIAP